MMGDFYDKETKKLRKAIRKYVNALHRKTDMDHMFMMETVAGSFIEIISGEYQIPSVGKLVSYVETTNMVGPTNEEEEKFLMSVPPKQIGCGDPDCKNCGPLIARATELQKRIN